MDNLIEAQPATRFVVSPGMPTAASLDPDRLSLAELEQLHRDWLAYAHDSGLVTACMQVARWCGEPFQIRFWESRPAWMWTAGDLKLLYSRYLGNWLPAKGEFSRHESIIATLGPAPAAQWQRNPIVLNVHISNDPCARRNDVYVHGSWAARVLDRLHNADANRSASQDLDRENERLALAGRLLIGISI